MSIHKIRIGLILILFGLGLLMHVKTGISPAYYFYLTAFFLLLTHFLFGNVWSAFSQLRKGNAMEAELMLSQIKKPNWLMKSSRAYFYFTRGMIELQKKNLKPAEEDLLEAHNLGMRTANDNALVTLNLAHICLVEKRKAQSLEYLTKTIAYEPNDLMLKDNIKKLELALKGK